MEDNKRQLVKKVIMELDKMNFSVEGITINDIIDFLTEKTLKSDPAEKIADVLEVLGTTKTESAYDYIVYTIEKLQEKNEHNVNSVIKEIYPIVAEKYGVTVGQIRVSIGNQVVVAWRKMNMETRQKYFGNPYRKPNARQYIKVALRLLN